MEITIRADGGFLSRAGQACRRDATNNIVDVGLVGAPSCVTVPIPAAKLLNQEIVSSHGIFMRYVPYFTKLTIELVPSVRL